jgi:hypothetical protein
MLLELVPAGVAVCAIVAMLWLEHRFARRETALRRRLGGCRTALDLAESARDWAEAELGRAEAQLDRVYGEFQAQGAELARYRRQHAPHDRLTRVHLRTIPGDPTE